MRGSSAARSAPAFGAALTLVALLSAGCATQREQRVSSADARERPSDERCEASGKGNPPSPLHVWACGYWHWDAARYVWVEGRWEMPR